MRIKCQELLTFEFKCIWLVNMFGVDTGFITATSVMFVHNVDFVILA